jgi:ElaB/YqjD/DUF883 family membrane-anchored ribosome-binding protein
MAAADLAADVEALKKDLSALRNDIRSLNDTLAAELQERVGRATDGVTAAARETLSSAAQAGERGYSAAVHQIEAHPMTSILMAAGIGVLIGSMLRR